MSSLTPNPTASLVDRVESETRYDLKYLKEQEELFDRHLPELIESYAGRYVVFENGLVIDSDEDENFRNSWWIDRNLYTSDESIKSNRSHLPIDRGRSH